MPEKGACPFPLLTQWCQQGCRKAAGCQQHPELRVLVGAGWALLNQSPAPFPYMAPEAAWLLTLLLVSLLAPSPTMNPNWVLMVTRNAGIQQGSPFTEVQQTTGCTATLQQSQHLFSIFFIQRKSTAVIPAEQCLPATALPRQERGTAALVGEDRQLLACLLPGKGELLGFISFIFPFRSRACSQPWLFPSLLKRMNISPPLQNQRSCHFTY